MTRKIHQIIYITILSSLLVACGGDNAAGRDMDYEATKKMVVDILQTEEGKKALNELMAEDKMKEKLVIDADVVKKSINEALASEKGKKAWEKLFEDPKFVKTYAESMKDSLNKLIKDLMKDPAFQKQMIELLQNPEMEAQMLKVMKSQKFSEHMEKSIQETFESPLFQAKIQEILLKAATKQGGSGGKEKEKEGSDGGSTSE